MASEDFRRLTKAIHEDGCAVLAVDIKFTRVDDGFSQVVEVKLRRDGDTEVLRSSEADFAEYAWHLQNVADSKGEVKLIRVKNTNQYHADIEHLIDTDGAKIRAAVAELQAGKFKFTYDPDALLEEAVTQALRPHSKRYEPLKRDFHRILALHLLHSQRILGARGVLLAKRPAAKKHIDAIEDILSAFRVTGNPLQDFRFYRNYADFDLGDLAKRVEAQTEVMDNTIRDLLEKRSVPSREGIPRLLDVYKTVLEVTAPVLNLIRVGLELKKGVKTPAKDRGLTQNVHRIRTDPTYGPTFSCLDSNLRHASAHAAFRVEGSDVKILDYRGKKAKVLASLPGIEVARVVQEAHQSLFPAALNALALQETAMKDLIVVSREYKIFVLGIGNV